jgi:hypothetical protein
MSAMRQLPICCNLRANQVSAGSACPAFE